MKSAPWSSRLLWISVLAAVLSGCSDLPRDVQRSTEKIQQSRVLVVGISPVAEKMAGVATQEKRLVEQIARRLGARMQWRRDNAHHLLQELEEVKLPLVAATIPSDSPFADAVGLSQPYLDNGPDERSYCLAVAPGENRLLLLVDQIIAAEKKKASS